MLVVTGVSRSSGTLFCVVRMSRDPDCDDALTMLNGAMRLSRCVTACVRVGVSVRVLLNSSLRLCVRVRWVVWRQSSVALRDKTRGVRTVVLVAPVVLDGCIRIR